MPRFPQRHTRAALALAPIRLIPVIAVLTVASLMAAGAAGARARHVAPRTFYVALNGLDSNPGTSPWRPWASVSRVDRAKLRPGDTVLFRAHDHFADDALMPGGGYLVSGTGPAPITFGSYGGGEATITDGVWLGTDAAHPYGPQHLTFENLMIGPGSGFQGTGSYIKLLGLSITNMLPTVSHMESAILTEGSHWVIKGNYIAQTGDSGMLLGFSAGYPGAPAGGSHYLVADNVIEHTGVNPAITYGSHGIYVKVANATVKNNTIVDFRDDGISARYRNAHILGNTISNGGIGIAWYQYDRRRGTSRFIGNKISDTSSAGIFVCGVAESCRRGLGKFVIARNQLRNNAGGFLNLQPVSGRYVVFSNH